MSDNVSFERKKLSDGTENPKYIDVLDEAKHDKGF